MACNVRLWLTALWVPLLALMSQPAAARGDTSTPEARAIAFLAREVPEWSAQNHCYSCHNNGDAARALILAARADLLEDRRPLADTLAFLRTPDEWDDNGPEGPFKDKKLARIQFAGALVDASATAGAIAPAALATAGKLVAELQQPDGSWQTDVEGTLGSPATYGTPLATYMALRVLSAADPQRYRDAIAKSRQWFHTREPQNLMAAAATLLALRNDDAEAATKQRAAALQLIARGQSRDGGWGPFVTAPPEPFDTALVLIALASRPHLSDQEQAMVARGRSYLISRQEADGSWPPTTRPPGAESYAQRLSTTGWATQALLATRATK